MEGSQLDLLPTSFYAGWFHVVGEVGLKVMWEENIDLKLKFCGRVGGIIGVLTGHERTLSCIISPVKTFLIFVGCSLSRNPHPGFRIN